MNIDETRLLMARHLHKAVLILKEFRAMKQPPLGETREERCQRNLSKGALLEDWMKTIAEYKLVCSRLWCLNAYKSASKDYTKTLVFPEQPSLN